MKQNAKDARLVVALEKFAKNLSDTKVYSAPEWDKRGEKYGKGSAAIITTEDELYEALNYGENPALVKKLQKLLEKRGYYMEPAYGWMWCVEPIPQ